MNYTEVQWPKELNYYSIFFYRMINYIIKVDIWTFSFDYVKLGTMIPFQNETEKTTEIQIEIIILRPC